MPQLPWHRRRVLQILAALAMPGVGACAVAPPTRATATLFVPGYRPGDAALAGEPADSRRRRRDGADGPTTLLTRLDLRGGVRQAVLPVRGHDVTLAPDGASGVFAQMGAAGNAHHLSFDATTLEVRAESRPLRPGWRGGGHAVFLPGADVVVTSERRPVAPWQGRAEAHHGRLALRDAQTLEVLDSVSCHGIDPHEIRLLEDGRHVAVANYGSVPRPGETGLGHPRRVEEASLTVVDLQTGRLVRRFRSHAPEVELRHLAAGPDRFLAIRARTGPANVDVPYLLAEGATEPDRTVYGAYGYLPAPPLLFGEGAGGLSAGSRAAEARMRQGLSVEYDPVHGEFLATFPSTHRVMVFDAETGALRREIDTAARGLRYPCGLALLPGGRHYAVAGHLAGLHLYVRGSHRRALVLDHAPAFHGHSHIAAA